jgi:hypothetical protein
MGIRSNEPTMATRRESLHLMAAGELLGGKVITNKSYPIAMPFHLRTRRLLSQ